MELDSMIYSLAAFAILFFTAAHYLDKRNDSIN